MRKTKPTAKKSAKKSRVKKNDAEISLDQAMQFIEDFRTLGQDIDEPTQMISIRIPANVLRAFKTKAKLGRHRYQSEIVRLMREWTKAR